MKLKARKDENRVDRKIEICLQFFVLGSPGPIPPFLFLYEMQVFKGTQA
jgi:hypothetical protein